MKASSLEEAILICSSFPYISFSYISSEIIIRSFSLANLAITSKSFFEYTVPVGLFGEFITIAFVFSLKTDFNS